MIEFNQHRLMRVHTIFQEDKANMVPDIFNIIEILGMFNTYTVDNKMCMSNAYWEFLHACLDNIASGKWKTLPRFWIEYVSLSRDSPLLQFQIEANHRLYLQHRKEICYKLKLSDKQRDDPQVILRWIKNLKAERDILAIAHALLRMRIYFTQENLLGLDNSSSRSTHTYNDSNQRVPALIGDNEVEILKDNFFDDENQDVHMV